MTKRPTTLALTDVQSGQVWADERPKMRGSELTIVAVNGAIVDAVHWNPRTDLRMPCRVAIKYFGPNKNCKGHTLKPRYRLIKSAPGAQAGAA